jgi:hypothetical protein
MGHYIYWADAERKADTFAFKMVRGLALRREKISRVVSAARASTSIRVEESCRVTTRNRLATRTVGGSIRERTVNAPDRRNGRRQPER